MKFGFYADRELPDSVTLDNEEFKDYKLNSHGYRCPEWDPMPEGKKNVVVLGCSHTFGQGNADDEHWVHFLSQHNTDRLRYWNLAQPGASADKVVRTLYGCEKILDPKIVIVCWPFWSRRERLGEKSEDLISYDSVLKNEDEHTDKNNFLKNVFLVEKLAEKMYAKTFHCFAQHPYDGHLQGLNVLADYTIRNCWPYWDKHHLPEAHRDLSREPDLASDGVHYGVHHHRRFAELFLKNFSRKLK